MCAVRRCPCWYRVSSLHHVWHLGLAAKASAVPTVLSPPYRPIHGGRRPLLQLCQHPVLHVVQLSQLRTV